MQLNGTRVFIYLSYSDANATALGAAGAIPVALANTALDRPKELVSTSIYLLASLSLVPANKELVVKVRREPWIAAPLGDLSLVSSPLTRRRSTRSNPAASTRS